MFPALIGAAVVGGIAYALSGDDKKNEQWYVTTEKRIISESELPAVREISESRIPPDIRRKLKRQ